MRLPASALILSSPTLSIPAPAAAAAAKRRPSKKAKKSDEDQEEDEGKGGAETIDKGVGDQERAEGGSAIKSSSQDDSSPKDEEDKEASRFLEKGLVYFFYRPKVGLEDVHSLDEVALLPPASSNGRPGLCATQRN
jgi:hypothetical protein